MSKLAIKVKEATEPKTRVWFGIEQDEDGEFQETLAVFVDDIHNGRVSVYSPVGQHSEADIDYVRGLYACTHPKSDALYNELKGLGYDLEVINTNAAEQVLGTMFPDGNQREDEDPSEFDVYESKKSEATLDAYRKKAKELGGRLRIRSNSLGKFGEIMLGDTGTSTGGSVFTKELLDKYKPLFDLHREMANDPDIKAMGIIVGESHKQSESKKNESAYGTVRVDSEDIAIKVQESNVYPSSSGRSLSGDVPKVESWFSTLSEFSDCIDGMAEDCNGYPDISRDGSDILVKINAPMEDENGEFNGDYEVIVELRCSTEITNGSLDGVVDLLNHE